MMQRHHQQSLHVSLTVIEITSNCYIIKRLNVRITVIVASKKFKLNG